jgi:hypothetical protein
LFSIFKAKYLFDDFQFLASLSPAPLKIQRIYRRHFVWQQKKENRLYVELSYIFNGVNCLLTPEPVFLNVYGAQESIPKNEFRQPM